MVSAALALPKLTAPGPLTLLQVVVRLPGGLGKPSSLTVPCSVAVAGKVMVKFSLASTTGGSFLGMIVMVSVSVTMRSLSLALSCRVYSPVCEKVAVVLSALLLAKLTAPAPLCLLHVTITTLGGLGKPSSLTVPARETGPGKVTVCASPASTVGG